MADLTYIENTGIRYKERYPIVTGQTEEGTLYYKPDFESQKVTIYNSDYDVSRAGNPTEVVGYWGGEIWNEKDASCSPVFKKGYLDGITDGETIEVNVTIDRGNASAFERHFKLMEYNSLEDIELYEQI